MPDWPTSATGEEPGSAKLATSVKVSIIANNVGTEPVAPNGLGLPSLPFGKTKEGLVVRDQRLVLHRCS